MLLSDQWVEKEIEREIKNILGQIKIGNTTYQNLWDAAEAVIRGKFIAVNTYIKKKERASLVVQWLRICLPMQGTRVRSLAREDPTCCGATKPVRHNY